MNHVVNVTVTEVFFFHPFPVSDKLYMLFNKGLLFLTDVLAHFVISKGTIRVKWKHKVKCIWHNITATEMNNKK